LRTVVEGWLPPVIQETGRLITELHWFRWLAVARSVAGYDTGADGYSCGEYCR
jgi:hypothetical protein